MHPLEIEPGRLLPQGVESLGQAGISLSISVGPTPALTPRPATLEDGMRGREGWRDRHRDRDKGGITKERVRGRLSQQKERKATQMLAIVLGEENQQHRGNRGNCEIMY